MSGLRIASLGLSAVLLAACGPKPPDYAFLQKVQISPEVACGQELRGDELVDLAYDGEPFGGVPAPETIPDDALQAATDVAFLQRLFACARTADAARTTLEEAGYVGLALQSESGRLFAFDGTDPLGFEGTYTVFHCDFVGDVFQNLDPPPPASVMDAGNFGNFGVARGDAIDLQLLTDLAAVFFRTRMTRPIPTSTAYVRSDLVFVGVEDALTTAPFPGDSDPARTFLPWCATWVEQDVVDECDRIYLGVSFNLILDAETGAFLQTVLVRQPLLSGTGERGLEGWCRRE